METDSVNPDQRMPANAYMCSSFFSDMPLLLACCVQCYSQHTHNKLNGIYLYEQESISLPPLFGTVLSSSGCDRGDVHPHGEHVVGVGKRLHRERKLHLRVSGLVDPRSPHHLHDVVDVYKAGVKRKT